MPVEDLDELGEVGERAREPVDLVDDDHVDEALLDVGEQPLQPGPLQRGAGDAAVVVGVAHQHPALRLLAGDVGLAGLALGVQRVELLLQPFLAALARVDGAAELADHLRHPRLRWLASPKNERPVPARAGDGAGDGGERAVRPALPLEAVGEHGDDMLGALPLADEPGADDRLPVMPRAALHDVAAVQLLAHLLQPAHGLGLQPAIGQLLDPVGEPALEEGPVVGRRLGAEELAPLLLQLRHRHGLQRGQARRDRVVRRHASSS